MAARTRTLPTDPAKPAGPAAPKLVLPDLPALTPTRADAVLDADSREREHYQDQDFTGQDLQATSFLECHVERGSFDDADLSGSQWTASQWTAVDAPRLRISRSGLRSLTIKGSRLGSVEAYDANWKSVLVSDSKIAYLNARAGTWSDVVFRRCVIDDLDLNGLRAARVSFEECQVGSLDLTGARVADVDLRHLQLRVLNGIAGLAGCWISTDQLTEMAPLLAAHLKINIA